MTKFPEGTLVYRGMGGLMALLLTFSQADQHGCKGFTEWGFMSTTTKRDVAIQYSGVKLRRERAAVLKLLVTSIVLKMLVTSIDSGAPPHSPSTRARRWFSSSPCPSSRPTARRRWR